jgi:hypothetical protein
MVKTPINLERAKEIAERKRLVPATLATGKGYLTFVRKDLIAPGRFNEVTWADVERILKERNLALYESGSFLLIRGKLK